MSDTGFGRYAASERHVTARLGTKGAEAAETVFGADDEKPEPRPGMPKRGEEPDAEMDFGSLEKGSDGPAEGDGAVFDEMLAGGEGSEEEEGGEKKKEPSEKKPEKKEWKDGDDKKKDGEKGEKKPDNPAADAADAASDLSESLSELAEVFEDLK